MCPAPETFPDPYEDFMFRHLRYYGYFQGQKGNLPNSARNQPVWKNSPQHLPHGPTGEREHLISEGHLRKDALLWPRCLSSSKQRWKEAQNRDPRVPNSPHLRSKQLLYESGDGTPRLRGPRDLFGVLSTDSPQQAPRWPIECEVIKETVRHIEWVPPHPEYFYQPTGNERLPEIVGEEKGRVVYQLDSVPREDSHFTSSRVGGRRGSLKTLAVTLEGPADETLLFESRFESGNLQKAVRVGTYEYELTLRADLYTNKHTQWFYFRVQNTREAAEYRFTIVNLFKAKSLYAAGMRPLLYSQADAQARGVGWRRAGGQICYYRRAGEDGPGPSYCLTWTIRFPHDHDTCYFAHFYPYTYSDLQRRLRAVAVSPAQSRLCQPRVLCRSLAGNPVYLLTITNPARSPTEAAAKRAVVLSARVHPGESNGSWVMSGFLDFILGSSADAQLLRDVFIFKVIPMLNPDGVIVGNYRCSLAGRDLNRHYGTALKDAFPCIWHTRNMIKRLLEEREVLLYCDFHGHSRKHNVFLYGCSSGDRKSWLHERVFPLMLSRNAPDKVGKCKEGTGRVVMWRMGIRNSYTVETTFGGSTLGSKRDTHFTTEDLKSVGHLVCDTLLDFCDPDRTKFTQCLAELQNLLQQQIHKKLRERGQDMPEGSWSDVSLSDIESSTSGSDSSLSDGLPVHQLSPAREGTRARVSLPCLEPSPQQRKVLKKRKPRSESRKDAARRRRLKPAAAVADRPGFPAALHGLPASLPPPEGASAPAMRNRNPSLNQSQVNGRGRAAFLGPPAESAAVPAERQGRMQNTKPTPTFPFAPKRRTRTSREAAPSLQAPQPQGQSLVPRRGRRTLVAYPTLHICTYP